MEMQEFIDRVNKVADGVQQLEMDTISLLWDVTYAVERISDGLEK
jgi:hypothetical protein